MKRIFRLAAAFLASTWMAVGAPPALAYFPHGTGSVAYPGCPNQATAAADGCGALATSSGLGSFQEPNFFADFAQSGQTYATIPTGWNRAGIDYPVGVSSAKAGSLLDPATASLPSGCTYSGGAAPAMVCNGVSNLVVDGYDFRAQNGHSCIQLQLHTLSVSVRVSNNNFERNVSCYTDGSAFGITTYSGSSYDFYLISNTIKGHVDDYVAGGGSYTDAATNVGFGSFNTSGKRVIEYNAFSQMGARPTDGIENAAANPGDITLSFNIVSGLTATQVSNPPHAEVHIFETGYSPTYNNTVNMTWQNVTYSYNVIGASSHAVAITAPFYMSSGAPAGQAAGVTNTIVNAVIDHNIAITNKNGGATTSGSALVAFDRLQYTNTSITNNYFDGTGAIYHYLCSGAPWTGGAYNASLPAFVNHPTLSGNYEMVSGATANAIGSTSGADLWLYQCASN